MPSRTTACRGAAAAGQPAGVLMASPRTVSGRASAERGRGRSQRAYCGGGRLTGCCRDSDRPHATRPGPPAAAAHHRQSGDPDRIPAARRAQRPAHGRPLRASDRHHRAPGISRSWQHNGRITAQEQTRVAPLFGRCDVHRSSTGNEPHSPRPPLTHWRPGRSSGQRSAGLWPSLSRAHDGEGGPRTPFDQADPARSPVLVRTPSGAGRNQATYPDHFRVSSPGSPAVRLEFSILSLNPGLRHRCVAPGVWPPPTRYAATRR